MNAYSTEGMDGVNSVGRIAPVFTLAAVLLAGSVTGACGAAAAEGPESREGVVIATPEDFSLSYDNGLEVVEDPLALDGKAVRQPCTSGARGIQWLGCFPEDVSPLRWHRLWVRMRAEKQPSKPVTVKLDFHAPGGNNCAGWIYVHGTAGYAALLYLGRYGTYSDIYPGTGHRYFEGCTFSRDVWNHLEIYVDFDTETYRISLNGTLSPRVEPFWGDAHPTDIDSVHLLSNRTPSANEYTYWDNVEISEAPHATLPDPWVYFRDDFETAPEVAGDTSDAADADPVAQLGSYGSYREDAADVGLQVTDWAAPGAAGGNNYLRIYAPGTGINSLRCDARQLPEEGLASSVGICTYDASSESRPVTHVRPVHSAEVPADEYRWIDMGRFLPAKNGKVYVAPANNPENVAFIYVDRIAYAPDSESVPHPDWVNALKPKGKPGPELTLATDRQSDYAILLSAEPTTQDEKAAEDLSRWLNLMTDADFPVAREGDDDEPGGKAISIGRTALAATADLPELNADLEGGGYAIAVRGDTLYLLGGKARGIINAVYALLEEDLGCRWYTSQPRGQTIPCRPTLKCRPVPRVYVPMLADRREPYYTIAGAGDWSLRNRTLCINTGIPDEWGGYPKHAFGICHTFNQIISRSEFRDHPEYFSEVDGVRLPRQLCLTHPDVLKRALDKTLAALENDPGIRIVDISPNDGGGVCGCERCLAIDEAEGTDMGTLLTFVNAVADAVQDDYPEVRITTLAYLNTKMPPKTIRPRDNVLIWLCTDDHAWGWLLLHVWETESFQTALKAWHAIGAKMVIWDYPIDFHNYIVPLPNMPVVAENMRYYVEHGATGIFIQGQHCPTRGVDRELMRSWVWAKQLWDLSRDTRELIRDFNYGFYGKAAEPMQRYDDMLWATWERLHSDVDKLKALHKEFGTGAGGAYLTPEFVAKASGFFEEAERLTAGDPELLARVELAKLPILYLRIEQGPGTDVEAHMKRIDTFERIARGNNVRNVKSGLRGPLLDEVLTYWRDIAVADPKKLSFLEFDNAWRFKPDPDEIGIGEQWFAPELDEAGWSVVRSDTGRGWESQGFPGYLGYGWYRQTVRAPANAAELENLRLFFAAVDEQAEVYVNGKKAFEHTCKSTGMHINTLWCKPFAFDPKPFLEPGKDNLIAVRVHNSLRMGGIWKPAYLIWGEQVVSPRVVEDVIKMKEGE